MNDFSQISAESEFRGDMTLQSNECGDHLEQQYEDNNGCLMEE